MDPVTVFMLSNTVGGILVGLGKLLKDAKHNDKMLNGCEQNLVSLKLVIEQSQAALEDQATKDLIYQNGTHNVFIQVKAAFVDCSKFVDDLADSVTKSKSKSTRIVRAVNGKYRSGDRLELQRRIQQRKHDVQIGLGILTLQATLKTSNDTRESRSEIVKRIQALEDYLRNRFSSPSSADPTSSTTSESTAVVSMRLGSPLENAAQETISQAVAMWKERTTPPLGSVPTVETQTTMGASSADPNQPVIIAVCGMTGSGKSSFISAAAGFDVGVGRTLRSETSAEANSSKEKAALAKQFEPQFSRQLQTSQASADDKIARLTEQLYKTQSIDTGKDDKIENLAHQLRAMQDSNNNNNINSGNSTNRSYHNHLTPASSRGSDGYSGGSIPPRPEPPQLLRVPRPAKRWIARGEAEKTENLRRMREHERRLDAYYKKYGV